MLNATDITVTLGGRPVLRGVPFRAEPGQISAIVGPNGSGKTTLLRAMTGDVSHGGTVELNGFDTTALRPWDLAAMRAVLPQSSALAFPFSVAEVVRLGLQAGSCGDQPDIVRQALALAGLDGYQDKLCQELSGGEQQRVHLARVLCQVWQPVENRMPRWLFLDEPVASLDIGHQLAVMEIARSFAQRGGGVVVVMHDLNLTAMFADQMTVLSQGRVLASGPTPEVMTNAVLSEAYGCALKVNTAPGNGTTFLLPHVAERVALGP